MKLDGGVLRLHIIVDQSVEVFAQDGRVVLSDLVFPSPGARAPTSAWKAARPLSGSWLSAHCPKDRVGSSPDGRVLALASRSEETVGVDVDSSRTDTDMAAISPSNLTVTTISLTMADIGPLNPLPVVAAELDQPYTVGRACRKNSVRRPATE